MQRAEPAGANKTTLGSGVGRVNDFLLQDPFFRDRVGGQGKGKPFPLASKTKRKGVPET